MAIVHDRLELKEPFAIKHFTVDAVELVSVEIEEGGVKGIGECRPYPRYGESPASVIAEIQKERALIESDLSPAEVRGRLRVDSTTLAHAGGAARNAMDCALIDLEAKSLGTDAASLLGLPMVQPQVTTYTIGLGAPQKMAADARKAERPLLKVKLGTGPDDPTGDLARMAAVREAAPAARLIIDANEGWTLDQLKHYLPHLHAMDVEMIEQPLPAHEDEALAGLDPPVMLCADESCHTIDDLPRLKRLYGMVNIKLDKTGGLTNAIELLRAARPAGMRVMLGCMMASSRAMAPAQLLAFAADYIDLDAPLLLKEDRDPAIVFDGPIMQPASSVLWG